MKQYNGEKYIVSFTSFGERFNDAALMLRALFESQQYTNFHVVMTVYKDDVKNITQNLQAFIDADKIEVIVAEENLCPHLKYFYVMQKYLDKPIITLDDDRLYSPNTIELLVNKYESLNYRSIVANCAPVMSKTDNTLHDRRHWCVPWRRMLPGQMSYVAMAEGFAGVLYPPKCFEHLSDEMSNIKKCLYDDDVFLRVLGIKNKLPVTQSDGVYEKTVIGIDIPHAQEVSLAKHHNADMTYRADVTKLFNDELIKGFELHV